MEFTRCVDCPSSSSPVSGAGVVAVSVSGVVFGSGAGVVAD